MPTARSLRRYLWLESAWILFWSYVLLVAGGITGAINFRLQAASALGAALILGGWLGWRILRRELLQRPGPAPAWSAYAAALLLTTALSIDPRRSLNAVLLFGGYALFYFFWRDVLRAAWQADLLEKTLLIAGGILIGLGALEVIRAYGGWRALAASLPYPPPFSFRLYALGDANLGAAVVNLLWPLAAARALRAGRVARAGWLVYVAAALAFELFTASRGAWLGAAAAGAALAALAVRAKMQAVKTASPAGIAGSAGSRRARTPLRHTRALGLALAGLALAALLGPLALRQARGLTHGALLTSRNTFWGAAWAAFRADPLTGSGPGTFPDDYARFVSIPPDRVYAHAHSVPFTALAETGLAGLLASGWLLLALARSAWATHKPPGARASPPPSSFPRSVPSSREAFLLPSSGLLAALAGLAVHSLFDNHLLYPAVGLTAVTLVTLAHRPSAIRNPQSAVSPWLLALPALALAGLAGYNLRGYAAYQAGLEQAAARDWRGAATALDRAAELDPRFALYSLQAGFAYGQLAAQGDGAAQGDLAALETAIARYRRGLALEPDYALHYANLAALYAQAGQTGEALSALQEAARRAPESPLMALNLGALLEAGGQETAAGEAYRRALALTPFYAGSIFWAGTPLRGQALAGWLSSGAPAADPDPGAAALARGDLAAAQATYVALQQQWPQDPTPYAGLARVARARGDFELAARYNQAVLSLQTPENGSKVAPLLELAELAQEQGRAAEARLRYEQAFAALLETGSYGWGSAGYDPYAWYAFGRGSTPVDLLPQIVRADVPRSLAVRLLPLADLLEGAGEREFAAQVRRRLAELLGD